MKSNELKVGDKVQWVVVRTRGQGFGMSQRTGVVVEMGPSSALCRMRNGRKTWQWIGDLELESSPGQLTQFVQGLSGKEPATQHE